MSSPVRKSCVAIPEDTAHAVLYLATDPGLVTGITIPGAVGNALT